MLNDPREVIRQSPMTARQWIAVVLMIALNALDGFDVLSSALPHRALPRNGASGATRWAWCCRWN